MAHLMEPSHAVFAFWPILTYFRDSDTHLNNRLRPPSAYTAVVRLPTTAAFLVKLCRCHIADKWGLWTPYFPIGHCYCVRPCSPCIVLCGHWSV